MKFSPPHAVLSGRELAAVAGAFRSVLGRVAREHRRRLADPANPSLDLHLPGAVESALEAARELADAWRGSGVIRSSESVLAYRVAGGSAESAWRALCASPSLSSIGARSGRRTLLSDCISRSSVPGPKAPVRRTRPSKPSLYPPRGTPPILSPSLDVAGEVPSEARNGSLPESGVVAAVGHCLRCRDQRSEESGFGVALWQEVPGHELAGRSSGIGGVHPG